MMTQTGKSGGAGRCVETSDLRMALAHHFPSCETTTLQAVEQIVLALPAAMARMPRGLQKQIASGDVPVAPRVASIVRAFSGGVGLGGKGRLRAALLAFSGAQHEQQHQRTGPAAAALRAQLAGGLMTLPGGPGGAAPGAPGVEAAEDAGQVAGAPYGSEPALPPVTGRLPDVEAGEGLGELTDVETGWRRLDAQARPTPIESWAGPVAGPNELKLRLGISRSTLQDWRTRGAAIGLLKGMSKHVYPLGQFVDGRPVAGLSEVTRLIPNPRVAWQWLIEPKPSIGGAPLDLLKAGSLDVVVAAAERDFG